MHPLATLQDPCRLALPEQPHKMAHASAQLRRTGHHKHTPARVHRTKRCAAHTAPQRGHRASTLAPPCRPRTGRHKHTHPDCPAHARTTAGAIMRAHGTASQPPACGAQSCSVGTCRLPLTPARSHQGPSHRAHAVPHPHTLTAPLEPGKTTHKTLLPSLFPIFSSKILSWHLWGHREGGRDEGTAQSLRMLYSAFGTIPRGGICLTI